MIISDYNYQELTPYHGQYQSMVLELIHENNSVYDTMFSDELFGYRKGKIEMMLDIMYFINYLYSLIQQIKELEEDTIDNRIALLEDNQWDCIAKTLYCKGIKIGKYYNKILAL